MGGLRERSKPFRVVTFCFVAFPRRVAEAAHANEGAPKNDEKSLRRVPRPPRVNQNRGQIVQKLLLEAFGAILGTSGRFRDAPGTLRSSGTPSGRSGTLRDAPGRFRDAPGRLFGTLRDAARTSSGRFGTAFSRGSRAELFFYRCSIDFAMENRSFFSLDCAQIFDRTFDCFSIGFRSFFRSTSSTCVERSILKNLEFYRPWRCFTSCFEIARLQANEKTIDEAFEKPSLSRSKIVRKFDRKSNENRSTHRSKKPSYNRRKIDQQTA